MRRAGEQEATVGEGVVVQGARARPDSTAMQQKQQRRERERGERGEGRGERERERLLECLSLDGGPVHGETW